MAKPISVKLDDLVFRDAEACVKALRTNRNHYINQAVRFFNRVQRRRRLRDELQKESFLVRDSSMAVNREFDSFIDEGLE